MRKLLFVLLLVVGCVEEKPAAVVPVKSAATVRPAQVVQPPVLWWQVFGDDGTPYMIPSPAPGPAQIPGSFFYGYQAVFGPFTDPPPGWYAYAYGRGAYALAVSSTHPTAANTGRPVLGPFYTWGPYGSQAEAQAVVDRGGPP